MNSVPVMYFVFAAYRATHPMDEREIPRRVPAPRKDAPIPPEAGPTVETARTAQEDSDSPKAAMAASASSSGGSAAATATAGSSGPGSSSAEN